MQAGSRRTQAVAPQSGYLLTMNADNSKADRTRVGAGVIALRVAAIVLAIVAAYLGILWVQLGDVLADGAALENRIAKSSTALDSEISTFRGDPDSAKKLLPTLAKTRQDIAATRSDIADLGANLPPPLTRSASEYRSTLDSYANDVDAYYEQLAGIARFVVARSALIERAGQGLSALGRLSDPGLSETDIRTLLGSARDAVIESVDELRSLSASATSVYSSEVLLARLSTLSTVLDDIVEGLVDRDAQRVSLGTQAFSKLMQADWQTLFFQADEQGLDRFAASLSKLSQDRARVAAASESIASTRTAIGAAAIALLVVAAFMAGVAWLR